MKLIGSKVEQEFRLQLLSSKEELLHSETKRPVRDLLMYTYSNLKTFYIVDWILEQGEDIYQVLINEDVVVEVEVSRVGEGIHLGSEQTVQQYLKSVTRTDRIKLAVALDLAKKDMG